MKMSRIIRRYNITENDLEYDICTDTYCLACEPCYRFDTSAPDKCIVCYDLEELNAGIRVPQYFQSIVHLLMRMPKTLRKIVIYRSGDVVKRYYNVENDLRIDVSGD